MTIVDVSELIDCDMALRVFIDQKWIFFIGKSAVYFFEDFNKVIELNMKNFFEANQEMRFFTFYAQNEILIFLKDKLLVVENEYYEVNQW